MHARLNSLSQINDNEQAPPASNGLLFGFMLAISSPVGVMFWLTSFAETLSLAPPHETKTSVYFVGLTGNLLIIAGVLLWGAFLSGCLTWGKELLQKKTINRISFLSGLFLLGYGLKYSTKAFLYLLA